jgi:hypothetical protein
LVQQGAEEEALPNMEQRAHQEPLDVRRSNEGGWWGWRTSVDLHLLQ